MESLYTTCMEMEFIKKLGTYAPRIKTSRLELLYKYKKTLDKRIDFWQGVEKPKLRMFVNREIEKEGM